MYIFFAKPIKLLNMHINKRNIIFIFIFLISLPLVFFGDPGFYGDDYHYIRSNDNNYTSFEMLNQWFDAYGFAYRPIGIIFHLTLFKLFTSNSILAYSVSLILYILLIYRAFSLSLKITDGKSIFPLFILVFFAFFPFNATAFYQLSSMYMLITYIGLFYFIEILIYQTSNPSIFKKIVLSLFWLGLLFSYESMIGISLAIPVLIFFEERKDNNSFDIKKYISPILVIAIPTLIFLFFYLSNPLNMKLISLNEINNNHLKVESLEENFLPENYQVKKDDFSIHPKKLNDLFNKISKSSYFFIDSIIYFYEYIKYSLKFIFFSIIGLLLLFYFTFKYKNCSSNSLYSFYLIIIGVVWTFGSILPFLIYPGFTIPTYHLLLPSFGLGIACYGFLSLIFNKHILIVSKYSIIIIAILFYIIQASYLIGLKEELLYWKNLAFIANKQLVSTDYKNSILIENIPKKNSDHIFWLEKAVGIRYFLSQINKFNNKEFFILNYDSIKIINDKDTKYLYILLDNSQSELTIINYLLLK